MSRGTKTYIWSLGVLLLLGSLWGCNGSNIDDPTKSDSVLVVDTVEPASVAADVSPSTDPNTLLLIPPTDDTVTVSVRNILRSQGATGAFNDVLVTAISIECANASLPSGTSPASFSIQGDSSADISVLVANGPYKQANAGLLLAIGSDICEITFDGVDLSGEPIISSKAVFGISYVDTP